MATVTEAYLDYTPPPWVRSAVDCLLSTVASGHLLSIASIELTNSHSIRRGKTRRVRGRKYHSHQCLGFYFPATSNTPARIQVIVDNTLRPIPALVLSLPGLREVLLGKSLIHEIGHHLDSTVGAPARTGEAAAEAWAKRLMRQHFRQRHGLFRAVVSLVMPLLRVVLRRQAQAVRQGSPNPSLQRTRFARR